MAIWGPIIGAGISAVGGWLRGEAEESAEEKRLAETARLSDAARAQQWRIFQERQTERREATRLGLETKGLARRAIGGYDYTPYKPYQPYKAALPTKSVLASMLRGELAPGQIETFAQQRRLGEETIARTAAGVGMPVGGRSALAVQLSRDIALGAGRMAGERQQFGVQAALPYEQMWAEEYRRPYEYGLQQWLMGEQAEAQKAQLMAQYAAPEPAGASPGYWR